MTEVREARVQRRRFAPIWLVPIAAVAIAGWLGWKTYSQRGPLITITFASAEGIEAGRTRIMLRNVEVGLVELLDLSRDLTHVEVHGRMHSDLAKHLTTGTRFRCLARSLCIRPWTSTWVRSRLRSSNS